MSNGSPGPEPPPKGKVNYEVVESALEDITLAVAAIREELEKAEKSH